MWPNLSAHDGIILMLFFCLRYTYEMWAEIGRYASVNGVPAASAIFLNKLGVKVSKSTVNVMKRLTWRKETDWFRGGYYTIS